MKSRVNKFKVPRASQVKYKIKSFLDRRCALILKDGSALVLTRKELVNVVYSQSGILSFAVCTLKSLLAEVKHCLKNFTDKSSNGPLLLIIFKQSLKTQAFADPRHHQPYFFRCCWRTISKYFTFKTFSRYQAFTWKIAEKWKAVWLSRVGQGLPSLISPTFENREFNLLTPKPAITGRDGPGPFFHFWRHLFWPK